MYLTGDLAPDVLHNSSQLLMQQVLGLCTPWCEAMNDENKRPEVPLGELIQNCIPDAAPWRILTWVICILEPIHNDACSLIHSPLHYMRLSTTSKHFGCKYD